MSKLRKFNVKTLLAIVIASYLLILTIHTKGATAHNGHVFFIENTLNDTVPARVSKRVTLENGEEDTVHRDSIPKVDTLKISKDSIDAPIKYNAEDSGVLVIATRQFYLYGKAKMDYKDMKLDAATIKYTKKPKKLGLTAEPILPIIR
jgi:hypothetical protein